MALVRRFLCSFFLIALINGPVAAQQPAKPMFKQNAKPNAPPGTPPNTPANTLRMASRVPEPRPSKEGVDFFEAKIRPVLVRSCYKCHSGDASKAKGHFVLDSYAGLHKGGDSGEVVVPRHPEKSLLIEALNYQGLEMPPEGRLPDEVIADFEKWVQMGAPDPRVGKAANPKNKVDLAEAKRYWAFIHPKLAPVPSVQDAKWPISDIDRFILARLEKENLKPVADADLVTLIRRLTFDLTGLPPTPEEIDAFVSDKSGNNVAKAVDRLLDSPRFGERWGRHWLDVVRYAESSGKERNLPYRYAWRYRDYVIDSFNADKPYDKFIIEQLAGDLIQSKNPADRNNKSLLIATGFLAIGAKSTNTKDPEQFKVDVIDDQIDVTGRAFLGITIACARCHDHKFDPIPQTDYYAMAGIFRSTETLAGMIPGRKTVAEEKLIKIPGEKQHSKTEQPSGERELQQEIAKTQSQLDELHREQKQGNKNLANGKGKKASPGVKVDQKSIREEIKKLDDRLEELEGQVAASDNLVMGVRDGTIGDYHLLVRGELKEKGPDVPRGVLTVLKSPQASRFDDRHSGRIQLANWIADRSNPLTARVMANRVWEHLFGQGLVDTVDNFGALGNDPSHPELLDLLALKFMENRWSIKKLIRMMVLTRVYQLSSEHDDDNYDKDPGDKFLWRMPRRRLDAEEIRDAMLFASGQLHLERPDGSPVMDLSNRVVGGGKGKGKGMEDIRKPSDVRSVYLPFIRGMVPDMLGAFDVADPNLIVGKRDVTTVPTQALFLMNNPFVLKQSEELAKRVLKEEGLDDNGRIDLAYRLVLGRLPSDTERTDIKAYIEDYRKSYQTANQKGNPQLATWTSFCQTLFQSGLFRYAY